MKKTVHMTLTIGLAITTTYLLMNRVERRQDDHQISTPIEQADQDSMSGLSPEIRAAHQQVYDRNVVTDGSRNFVRSHGNLLAECAKINVHVHPHLTLDEAARLNGITEMHLIEVNYSAYRTPASRPGTWSEWKSIPTGLMVEPLYDCYISLKDGKVVVQTTNETNAPIDQAFRDLVNKIK